MARKKKENIESDVTITKGSHLTVYTYADGNTKLEWDDAALMRDVLEAIASVSNGPVEVVETKAKKARKKKS